MRRSFISIFTFILMALSSVAAKAQEEPADAIVRRLVNDGFENVRASRNGNRIWVVLEDNHYRGIFRGLAHALQLISPSASSTDTIQLVALENRVPRLTVNASHVMGSWLVDTEYGGVIPRHLRRRKTENSSAYKVDIVPYPQLIFSNHRYDRLWSSALYLSPTVEMGLWPGAKLTAQMKFLVYNNFIDEHYKKVLPGYMVFSQLVKPTPNWDITLSAGLFNLSRNGVDARFDYHVNNSLELGVILGATGPWYVSDGSLTLCYWDKYNIIGHLNYYEHNSNLQFDLKGGRFLFEDYGFRLDINRHFRDYAVGIYGNLTTYNTNLGIEFSIPIAPKKMGKHRAVRVRMPETISFNFNENLDVYQAYNPDRMEQLYKTAPDQNYSARYWQPELIRDCIMLYLDGVID